MSRTPRTVGQVQSKRARGCLVAAFVAVFLLGGGFVLILQSAASTEPRSSRNYDEVHSLASLVTVGWLVVMIGLAIVWLFVIFRTDDDA